MFTELMSFRNITSHASNIPKKSDQIPEIKINTEFYVSLIQQKGLKKKSCK